VFHKRMYLDLLMALSMRSAAGVRRRAAYSGFSSRRAASINIAVDNADAAERATSLGGHTLLPPFDAPGSRNTVIADPQGGVLACSAPAPSGMQGIR
jgi:predicted enzyme related to lactoylglutathione lyase